MSIILIFVTLSNIKDCFEIILSQTKSPLIFLSRRLYFGYDTAAIGYALIHKWRLKYAQEMVLSLPEMTFQEKQDLALLQASTKELEK